MINLNKNSNYQAYAAAYGQAAFDQYQAAAAAAYQAMQQPRPAQPPPPPPPTQQPTTQQQTNQAKGPGGVSISQPAQRYDSNNQNAAQQGKAQNAAQFYGGFNKAGGNAAQNKTANYNKWGSVPFTTTPGQLVGNNNFNNQRMFNKQQRKPGLGSQQTFYCEVCKVSCAGPQVRFCINVLKYPNLDINLLDDNKLIYWK
jgi:hypothetical protein